MSVQKEEIKNVECLKAESLHHPLETFYTDIRITRIEGIVTKIEVKREGIYESI